MQKIIFVPMVVAVAIATMVMPLLLSAFTTWAFSTIGAPEDRVVALSKWQSGSNIHADQDDCLRVSRVVTKSGSATILPLHLADGTTQ
jgi:hypothetical protein